MITKLIGAFGILLKPGNIGVIFRDWTKQTSQISQNKDHLQSTMAWLVKAHNICSQKGVSAGYDMRSGWLKPYPETTGYIIPTFLKYARVTGQTEFRDRAIQMGKWEIDIQLFSGAVRGGIGINDYPIIFNTGQVLIGWLALYENTQDKDFLDAAVKAADWLVRIQNNNGSWDQFTYNNIPHAYHARVAWPLFKLFSITQDDKYKAAAQKNILWVLSQTKDTWIDNMGFKKGENPFTHTIVYTLRGLWESSFYVDVNLRDKIHDLIFNIAKKLANIYEKENLNDYLPATFNSSWHSQDKYSCLTGNIQLAIIWLKLYRYFHDLQFLDSAKKIIDQTKATQILRHSNPGIEGGVAGSYPIYGNYQKFVYPNWAAKFFADAIMLQEEIKK